MKSTIVIFFLLINFGSNANNPYRNYLLSKIEVRHSVKSQPVGNAIPLTTTCVIPHFERPKGAVFCRMEDYLTAKTKIWFTIGVK